MEIEQVPQINKFKWKEMCVETVTLLEINITKVKKGLLVIFKVFTKFRRDNLIAKKNKTIIIHSINRTQMTCLVVMKEKVVIVTMTFDEEIVLKENRHR